MASTFLRLYYNYYRDEPIKRKRNRTFLQCLRQSFVSSSDTLFGCI